MTGVSEPNAIAVIAYRDLLKFLRDRARIIGDADLAADHGRRPGRQPAGDIRQRVRGQPAGVHVHRRATR